VWEKVISFSENLPESMHVRNISPGNYQVEWIDCASGILIRERKKITASDEPFTKPKLIGKCRALRTEK